MAKRIRMDDYIPVRICDALLQQTLSEDEHEQNESGESLDTGRFVIDNRYIPVHILDDVVPIDIPHDQLINTVFRKKSSETGIPITELIQMHEHYR